MEEARRRLRLPQRDRALDIREGAAWRETVRAEIKCGTCSVVRLVTCIRQLRPSLGMRANPPCIYAAVEARGQKSRVHPCHRTQHRRGRTELW